MKISRWFAILAFVGAILVFVGLSSSTALAASIPPDPGFKLCCPVSGLVETSPSFTFTVTAGVDGFLNPDTGATNQFDFINSTGFTALELDIFAPTTLSLYCDPANSFFNSCSPEGSPENTTQTTEVRFFGIDETHPGIQNAPADTITCEGDCFGTTTVTGATFEIQADGVGLAQDTTFTALLVAAPEPSTVLLLLAGVAFLFLFRRAGWVPKLT